MTPQSTGRKLVRTLAGCSCALIALASPQMLMAQDAEAETDLAALMERIEELETRDEQAQARISALEMRLKSIEAEPLTMDELVTYRGRFQAPDGNARPNDNALAFFRQQDQAAPAGSISGTQQIADAVEQPDGEEEQLKEPAKVEAVDEVTEQQQGRFGDRLGFELGLGYTHFDDARINLDGFLALDAIFLGTISIDEVTADIFTVDPTVRLGLSDRFFVDASLPYLYRTSNFQSGGAGGAAGALIEESVSENGIGDASVGASFRMLEETLGRPDVVLSLRGKFPTGQSPFGVEFREVPNSEGNLQVPTRLATGSGVYGASGGLSVLKTLDPMVVFGNVTYFHNFPRNFDDIDENPEDQPGRVDVGDAIQFGAGLAFALNDRSSLSMSYSQRVVQRTRVRPEGEDWRRLVGSQANVGLVNLGATFTLTDKITFIGNVGIGLTDDSPDMAINLRLPFSF